MTEADLPLARYEALPVHELAAQREAIEQLLAAPDQGPDIIQRTRNVAANARIAAFSPTFEQLPDSSELMTLKPSAAFKKMDTMLGQFFAFQLQTIVGDMGESSLHETLEQVFTLNDWHAVKEGSQLKEALLDAFNKLIQLRGKLVQEYLDESEMANESMTAVEKVEYKHFGNIANSTNALFFAWRNELKTEEPINEIRSQRGFKNEVAVVRKVDDEYSEVPWHEAFPEPTAELSRLYAELADDLDQLETDDAEASVRTMKIAYYRSLSKAWASSDMADWRVADALLPQQILGKRQAVHIHTIERGYASDHFQRVPEASMRYPDDDFEFVDEMGEQTKLTLLKQLEAFVQQQALSDRTLSDASELLQKSAFSARHVMGSGSNITFMAAAQVLPNEFAARAAGGVDITSNPPVMSKRLQRIKGLAEKYLGPQFSGIGEDDGPKMSANYVAGHEYSHVIGLHEDTEKRLPPGITGAFCEEWKASAGTYVLRHWMAYQEGGEEAPTLEDVQQVTQLMVLNCMRYLGLRDDSHAQPYVRKSIMLMRIAQDAGVVYKNGDKWEFTFDEASLTNLYTVLSAQYAKLLGIYHSGNVGDLAGFVENNLQPSPFVEEMAAKLDADDGVSTRPSIADLCRFQHAEAA